MPLNQANIQGTQQGLEMPSRFSGIAGTIKAITANLNEKAKAKDKEKMDKFSERSSIVANLLKYNYRPTTNDALNNFLESGDLSGFSQVSSAGGGMSAGGASGSVPPGMRVKTMNVNDEGATSYVYEPATIGAGQVGQATLARKAIADLGVVKTILYPQGEKGPFARGRAAAGNLPMNKFPLLGGVIPQSVPFLKNPQELNRRLRDTLAAKILIQTGVAARPEEVAAEMEKYLPTGFSNPESTLNGLIELQTFYETFIRGLETGKVTWVPNVGIVSTDGSHPVPAGAGGGFSSENLLTPTAKGYKIGEIITGPDGQSYRITGGDPNDPDVELVGGNR